MWSARLNASKSSTSPSVLLPVINRLFKRLPVVVLAMPCLALAQAQTDGAAPVPSPMSSPMNASSMLSLVTSLIFVIGAILFVGWLYSRMRGVNLGASKVINVLASQPLGPKEKIVVVQIGGKQIAVGMTPSSLQTLHVFDEPVVAKREGPSSASFSERLRSALGRGASK